MRVLCGRRGGLELGGESLVTGESIPVEKGEGDEVVGGSVHRSGSLVFEATKIGAATALGQIIDLVERAQNSKASGSAWPTADRRRRPSRLRP